MTKLFNAILAVCVLFTASANAQVSTYAYTGAVQTYTVPAGVTNIQIDCLGAGGGSGDGGAGGQGTCMQGAFEVTPGDVLEVIVGEQGLQWGNSGGGGGGSGVLFGGAPLIIAGGGGGGATNAAGKDASIMENGVNSSGAGGVGGLGGQKGYVSGDCGWASGGGGFTGDGYGGDGVWDGGALPGTLAGTGGGNSWASGGAGGVDGGCTWTYPNSGGWGCGAGAGGSYGGGGGGGYSGGGGGQYVDIATERGGGGGGSYNDGTDQVNSEGCNSGNGEVTITVLCNGLDIIAFDDEICDGEEVTLDATSMSGAAITWDMGVVNGVPFTPAGVGTISYTATSADPDDCELTVDIIVNANPTVTVSVDETEICDGETVIFTEGGDADTYTWDPVSVVAGVAYSPASTGTITYTLTGTNDITGCFTTSTIDVTMHELPTVTATVDFDEICLGDEVIFTGGGATTYIWDMGVTDGVGFTPAGLGTETYTVIGTDAATGCENTASVTVTVNDSPVVTATADDDEVCDGELVTLTGGGAGTYTWDLGVTDGVAFAPPVGTTTYTVTGETGSGCEATATIDITVNPVPAVTASVDAIEICFGDDVVFTGGGADTYVWDLGVVDGVPFTPGAIGTFNYTVIGTVTATGCSNMADIDVTVLDSPTVTASASDASVCEGETITLNGGGATTYTWDLGVMDGVSFTPPVGTTTYTVTGETGAGCVNTASIDITVNPTPVVVANSSSTEVCLGESFVLTGSGADSYAWDLGAIDGGTITPAAIGTTTYTVVGSSAFGCTASASIIINVIDCEPVVPAFTVPTPICVGDCITITDASTGAVASWSWDFGGAAEPATSTDQNPVICVTTAGVYTIELTTVSSTGATATITNTLTVNDNPLIAAMTDTVVDLGTIASLMAFSPSSGTFSWSPDENIICADCNETNVFPIENTTYVATITDVNGCSASDSVKIFVNIIEGIGVPTAFSPNGDGNNDVLYVKGFALETVNFVIYNRYGEVVFETSDQTIGWDGTFKNQPENPGVFTWVLYYEFIDGSTGMRKGNTTLIR